MEGVSEVGGVLVEAIFLRTPRIKKRDSMPSDPYLVILYL